jgi:hypothetical protein
MTASDADLGQPCTWKIETSKDALEAREAAQAALNDLTAARAAQISRLQGMFGFGRASDVGLQTRSLPVSPTPSLLHFAVCETSP